MISSVGSDESAPLYDYKALFLFRSVDRGHVRIAEWALHPTYDIACGRLSEGAVPLDTIALETRVVMPSTAVICAGFPASGAGTLLTFERNVAGRTHAGFLLDGAAAPGLSGGPALVSERAVGVVYADMVDENVTFLVPINEIASWIERALPPRSHLPQIDLGLSAFPIAGSLRPYEIPQAVVHISSRKYDDGSEARRFFADVMRLRAKHNPEGFSENQILVRPQEIVWDTAADRRWERIFYESSLRSQRTVAAFFYADGAPNPDFLQVADKALFEEFRARLMY